MTLSEVYDLKVTNDMAILVPKDDDWKDKLFFVSGMNGDERMIKVQRKIACRTPKMYNYTIRIMPENGKPWSFDWGFNGYTLISEGTQNKKKAIMNFIHSSYPQW